MKKLNFLFAKRSFLFKIRFCLGAVALILVLVFIYLKIVPFGNVTYSRTWPRGLASGKGFVYDFKPAERIDTASSSALRIVAEPVYFSLFAPRAFDKAEITIKYRDKLATTTPIIEVGVLRDKLTERYELRPIQNDVVDRYRFSWARLVDNNERLILQASKYYEQAADFETDLKNDSLKECPGGLATCVATYNFPLQAELRSPDYEAISPTVITQPLRGANQFYVYFKNGIWRLAFDFVDLNLDQNQDPIVVNVYSGATLIATKTLNDNDQKISGGQSEEKKVILSGQAKTGLYRVEVRVSDDIVMSKLNSSSDKLAFVNKIWPVSGTGSLILYTDASYVGVSTTNPSSLGPVSFGGKIFDLNKTYHPFSFSNAAGVNKIILNKNDLVLENSGLFSFSPNSLMNSSAQKVDRYFLASDKLKYIIANYERPLENNGIKTARTSLDLKGAVNENNKYTFLISVPGLNGVAGATDYLEIEEIILNLQGKNIFQKMTELIRR